jgi:Kef-type K+ transport system membrane component KefB
VTQAPWAISDEVVLVIVLLVLIVLPRALQRYRVPGAITSLLLGFGAQQMSLVENTGAIHLFSTLGIVALFLFAGLEIDGNELRRNRTVLAQYGGIWMVLLVLVTAGVQRVFGLGFRPATLVALAIVTPSTGFILSSLAGNAYSDAERFAIKTKAISSELLALFVLFVIMQSTSAQQLGLAFIALGALVVFIPLTFKFFAAVVAPYAPRSEFAFLIGVAVVTALVTRELGVYYLLGAFLVGVAAQRFRATMPSMSSDQMIHALEAFGSVFIPFYFFAAGMEIDTTQTTGWAFALGLALLAVFVPLRLAITLYHRRWLLREADVPSLRVATALLPTLVFTLVLAAILRDSFEAPHYIVGALIIYTIVNTTLPAFLPGGAPPPSFESVHAPDVPGTTTATEPGASPPRA